ncbi:MAG: DUF3833 domain-containing protein [Pseudomonadota bacterium]|nr:DUF3833 domain-containing protein [Pseudomonadota bacterium]
MWSRLGLVLLSLVILSGCTTMKPTDFKNATPQLVIEEYFAGETQAWGLFEDRFGTIRRQFSVDIVGTWDGEFLTLDEKFVFEDGERDRRIWKIRKTGDKTYTGTADDVIGEATGRASGNALNWRYQMDLKVGTSTLRVRFDDWMFLQPSGVLLNRARVTKFGIEIGTVTLAFMKNAATAADQAHSNDWQSDAAPKQAANQ